jgi:diguanylate cyclase (GGDEF)-like protein
VTQAEDSADRILAALLEMFDAGTASLSTTSATDEEMTLVVRTAGAPDSEAFPESGHPAAAVHRHVASTGAPVLLTPAAPAGRRLGAAYRDVIAVPLRDGDIVFGSFVVADGPADRPFTAGDLALLESDATHTTAALRNGQLIDRLWYDATHDALTALANRSAWEGAARATLAHTSFADGLEAGVLLVDLDGFKDVNDTFGHHHGDAVLVEVARRLESAVAELGVLARFGGDEFVVLVPRGRRETILAVAESIVSAMHRPVTVGDVEVEVQTSVGVAVAPEHGSDLSTLLKRADLAICDGRSSGARVAVFHADLEDHGPNRLEIIADLRRALEDGEVRIAVQPKADLSTGDVTGAEVLARWTHPRRGPLPPDVFIPLAERSGLIRELTAAVLDQAVAECASWRAAGVSLSVAVNLSPRALVDDELLDTVATTLRRHGLPAQLLTLEITEGCVMNDPERAITALHHLRTAGVRLSVDDFGTGYSSLAYLKRLPIQEVKIDRSFVLGLAAGDEDALIIQAVADLGRNLGLDVVAEGVENEQVWDRLRTLGCTAAQGYYLSRPVPAADLAAWLAKRRVAA